MEILKELVYKSIFSNDIKFRELEFKTFVGQFEALNDIVLGV